MAQTIGKASWALDGSDIQSSGEKKEVEKQATDFCQQNADVINPLLDRIRWLKAVGGGDDLYMMASILLTAGNELVKYMKASEAATKDEKAQ